MNPILNIYGYTGTIWEIPDIDSLSIEQLMNGYRDIYFTQKRGDKLYLGTRDDVFASLANMLSRPALEGLNLTTELVKKIELTESEWRIVHNATEVHGAIRFPGDEMVVVNGGQYIATHYDGDNRYVPDLADNIARYQDPVIGTSQVFYDCSIMDITPENLTKHYSNSLLLIGGLLMETRSLYDSLTTSVNLKGKMGGWLPSLYKQIAEFVPPFECGLEWPISIKDLKSPELFNRLIAHKDSRLIVFKTSGPVTYQERSISDLFPSKISGILCYDGRPSPNRVTDLHHCNRSPVENRLSPTFVDLSGLNSDKVTIDHVVKDISPKEKIITYVSYEVKE